MLKKERCVYVDFLEDRYCNKIIMDATPEYYLFDKMLLGVTRYNIMLRVKGCLLE
jgi:hypothetical protein